MVRSKQKIKLGVRVIIFRKNKILIIRQSKINGRDVYILPGGGVEGEEDILACAEREVKEETFLDIRAEKVLYIKELFGPNLHSLEFYVLGKIIGGSLRLGRDPELSKNAQCLKEVVFIELEKLARLNFYPRELRINLKKDKRRNFQTARIYLGAQRFSLKQFIRLFGPK